ncbi:NAC domain containing protein [Trema orientale]|uniref:NAC domain containing protein n=1 Tax=Trema orientale TaxID=63057 RepID=A0A2P5FZ91_TREOI|nr:NAC domain containing protein [Trema orientale]
MYMLDSGQKERFFFTRKEHKSSKGEKSISKRTVSDKLGLWKSKNHHPKPVENSVGKVIGQKRKLVYHRGRYNDSQKTDWIMEEYSLVNESTPRKEDKGTKLDKWKWVICRVYRESTSKKSKKEELQILRMITKLGRKKNLQRIMIMIKKG